MGDDAVIVEGIECDENHVTFESTVHGAGRVMSRTAAKGKFKKGVVKQKGLVTRQMMSEWVKAKGVVVRGGDVDESPQAYRRLPDVLASHASAIEIVHTLRPIGVCMAGASDQNDPFRD